MRLRLLDGGRDGYAELLEARVARARSIPHWREIPVERLVVRGPGWLVDTETDLVYVGGRPVLFEPGSASPVAERDAITFFVNKDENVVAIKRRYSPRSWCEHVRRETIRGLPS